MPQKRVGHRLTLEVVVIITMVISILSTLYFALDWLFFLLGKSYNPVDVIAMFLPTLVPLAWMIPMTVLLKRKFKYSLHVSKKFKICSLIFCGVLPGTLLLCMKEGSVSTI